MEQRYDISFMKEYAKLYHKDNRWLAEKFHCGVKIVDKILNGEIQIKEKPMEDILYEFGYKDYNNFKADIIKKTNEMKKTNELKRIKEIKKDVERQKYNEMKKISEIQIEKQDNQIINKIEETTPKLTYNEIIIQKIKLRENVNCKTNPSDIFDYNSMKNIDRIIISLLCDDDSVYSIKQISKFLHIEEEYIKDIYVKVLSSIKYVNRIEPEKAKTKV